MPVYLFGHSAGGQFLSRVAAFGDLPGVARIVIANPSTHVMPNLEEAAPYGFGGLPEGEGERYLTRYLRRPVTIYLGGEDTGDENLYTAPAARRQGKNRLERGRTAYTAARTAAARSGVPCDWALVEAPGIGHDATGMLNALQAPTAFGLSIDAATR
jgi:pimeloyl-ACP methyl ester carboxylesterase